MSIQVKQPIPNTAIDAHHRDQAQPRLLNLSDRINLGPAPAIVSCVLIWGAFIWALWSLV